MSHFESNSPLRNSLRSGVQRAIATGVVLFSATSAFAFQGPPGGHHHNHGGGGGGGGNNGCGGAPTGAPEINPALLIGALVLVVGAVLILTGRRRPTARCSKS